MAHVTEAHVALLLRLVRRFLAVKDTVGDVFGRHESYGFLGLSIFEPDGVEKIERQSTVVASVQSAVEDLLDDIVYYVVQEVVPGETEKEILKRCEYAEPCDTTFSYASTYKYGGNDMVFHKADLQEVTNNRAAIRFCIEGWPFTVGQSCTITL
jgi:hypothetical protein